MKHGRGKAGLRGYATDCRAEVTAKKRRGGEIKDALQTTLGKTGVHPSPWPENVPHTFPRDGRDSSIFANFWHCILFLRPQVRTTEEEENFSWKILFSESFQIQSAYEVYRVDWMDAVQLNRQAVVGMKANLSSTFWGWSKICDREKGQMFWTDNGHLVTMPKMCLKCVIGR